MQEDNIKNDRRPITSIMIGTGDNAVVWATKGPFKCCDAIEMYYEPGAMMDVMWFRVIRGGSVDVRVQAVPFVSSVGYT